MNDFYDQISETYPVMFSEKGMSPQDSSMHWGIQCGKGWHPLLERLIGAIDGHLKYNPDVAPVIVTEIKEKFGTLRFRYRGGDDKIKGMVWMVELLSGTICETCGSNYEVTRDDFNRTVCKNCKETADE